MAIFKNIFRVLLLSLLTIIFLAPLANASYKGSIIMKDGSRYDDAQFDVNYEYKVVVLKMPGGKKNISFDRIDTILDARGTDITATLLRDDYKAPEETWKPENHPVYQPPKQHWNIAFRFGSNYSMPSGSYYGGIGGGAGLEGDLIIPFSAEISIRATISNSGMTIKDNYGLISPDPNVIILSQDIGLKARRYIVSIQYNRPVREVIPGKGYFYAYTGLGAVSHKFTTTALVRDSIGTYRLAGDTTITKFMTNIGIGGALFLSRHLALDGGAELDFVYVGSGQDSGEAYIFDFKLGMQVFF